MIKLISITPDAEKTMAYIARVSSPHQDNPDIAKLLAYCIRKGHWSVFEQASVTFEIVTSRMISAQILRHKSFQYQEFSQRYSEVSDQYLPVTARRQDTANRQNSIDDMPEEVKQEWARRQASNWELARANYEWALQQGIAKECARAVLPIQARTRLYMTGTVRSWIHYLQVRCDPATQLEHREIALEIRKMLAQVLPVVAEALQW